MQESWVKKVLHLIAYSCVSSSTTLSKKQRKELAMVLHHACRIGEKEVSVLTGIDLMVTSLRRTLEHGTGGLQLPTVLPVKEMPLINE